MYLHWQPWWHHIHADEQRRRILIYSIVQIPYQRWVSILMAILMVFLSCLIRAGLRSKEMVVKNWSCVIFILFLYKKNKVNLE
jgi:hypothetical protein